jgi:membrane protease subunit HflK
MESRKRRYEEGFGNPPGLALLRLLPWLPWIALGLLLLSLPAGAFYTVAPYEQAVVLRFGKYHATTMPGLQFKLPLADQVLKVSVEEHGLRMPFGTATRGEPAVEPPRVAEDETLMLTGDLNTASVEWTIQWKVANPEPFIRRFPGDRGEIAAEELLATIARTVMNRLVGDYSFDEVIGPKRSDIAFAARRDTQRILDEYGSGITVTALQMQRVIPPERVKPAFDKVNASIQEKQKLENEAESKRNQILPQARAAKDKLIREAEGFAARRKAEATGEIEALMLRYRAYQRAPDVTRQRLYLETMQEVLKAIKDKTILDADLSRLLPLLDLNRSSSGAKQ